MEQTPLQFITGVIAEYNGTAPESVKVSHELLSDLNIDSLDLINIIMKVEKQYNVIIPDKVMDSFKTVGDIVSYVTTYPMKPLKIN